MLKVIKGGKDVNRGSAKGEFKDNSSRKFEYVNLPLGAIASFYSRAEEGKYRSNDLLASTMHANIICIII